jgi:hypothetical protein
LFISLAASPLGEIKLIIDAYIKPIETAIIFPMSLIISND